MAADLRFRCFFAGNYGEAGQVQLMDMQLGVTLDDITATVSAQRPDILGVSVTFGQHDLLTRLLDTLADLTGRPLVLADGSLTALMTPQELRATYAFQVRRDLLLHPLTHLSVEEIVDGVRDEDFVAEHAAGQPFYTGISYLLVSMECLIGAACTRQVHAAGLAGPARPAMGRLAELLLAEYTRWKTTCTWGLINAADPCGT